MSSKHVQQKRSNRIAPAARCSVSGKLQFRTRKKALRMNGQHERSLDAYLCRHCGLWHRTTRPLDAA